MPSVANQLTTLRCMAMLSGDDARYDKLGRVLPHAYRFKVAPMSRYIRGKALIA